MPMRQTDLVRACLTIATATIALAAAMPPLDASAEALVAKEGWTAHAYAERPWLIGGSAGYSGLFINRTGVTQTRRVELTLLELDGPESCSILPDFTDNCGAGRGGQARYCIAPKGDAQPRCFQEWNPTGVSQTRLLTLEAGRIDFSCAVGRCSGYPDRFVLASLAQGADCYDNPDGSAANCRGCLDAPNDPSRCARALASPGFNYSSNFIDIPPDADYRAAVESIYPIGVTDGCGSNPLRFCPSSDVSRLQMAKLMLRAKHGPLYAPPSAPALTFTDVTDPSWAAWASQAVVESILDACGSGFCPDEALSRDHMARALVHVRYGTSYPPAPDAGFTDVDPGSSFKPYIDRLFADGVTKGCSSEPRCFCPDGSVIRASMALFVARNLGLTAQ